VTSVSSYDPNQYSGTGLQSSGTAEPGWYRVDQLSQQYWDGYEWTNHVAPLRSGGAAAQVSGMATSDQRTYELIIHLGSLFVGFVVRLVMCLITKDRSPFIDGHGKQLMKGHISLAIYVIISVVLLVVLIGIFLFLLLVVPHLVFSIMGSAAANKGDSC
jgi:uncharacterized Tic20 family protein